MKIKNCFVLLRTLLQGLDGLAKKLTFLMKFQRKGVALDLTWKRAMLIEMAKINDTYIDDINVE